MSDRCCRLAGRTVRVVCGLLLAVSTSGLAGCDREFHAWVVGVETIEPATLAGRLEELPRPLVIDLRDPVAYQAGHLPGAVAIPLAELGGYLDQAGPPLGHPVVAVCYHGNLSLAGASVLGVHGYRQAYSLAGGMARWQELGLPRETGSGTPVPPAARGPRTLELDRFDQWVIFSNAGIIKPIHMLLALLLIFWLRGHRSADLRLLCWGLLGFFVGETCCALNYLFAEGQSDALELVHELGMVLLFTLLPWGFLRLLDLRVFHFSDPAQRCALVKLCGRCGDQTEDRCRLGRILRYISLGLALVALIPLCAPLRPLHVATTVLGSATLCLSSLLLQLVEFRAFPLLAAALFLVAAFRSGGSRLALHRMQLPFFLGFGFLGFSLFRFLLGGSFGWAAMPGWEWWWEEATELLTVAATAIVLWEFRHALGLARPRRPVGDPAGATVGSSTGTAETSEPGPA